MDCKELSLKLNAYLDGELSGQMAARVREHLQACPRCAEEMDELRLVKRTLDAVPGAALAPDFATRIRKQAEERQKARTRLIPIGLRLVRLPAAIAATLLIVAGLLLGGLMGSSVSAIETARQSSGAQAYEELDLQIDSLSAIPSASLTAAYMELTDEPD